MGTERTAGVVKEQDLVWLRFVRVREAPSAGFRHGRIFFGFSVFGV